MVLAAQKRRGRGQRGAGADTKEGDAVCLLSIPRLSSASTPLTAMQRKAGGGLSFSHFLSFSLLVSPCFTGLTRIAAGGDGQMDGGPNKPY